MGTREDEELAGRVLESIKQDKGLSAYEISVRALDGAVHLSGVVDVLVEKMRAGDIASRVTGVDSVENGLTVCTDGQITDDDVAFEVAEELRLDNNVDTSRVHGESSKGVVHLHGHVDSLAHERAAITAAARARGVKEIVSHLAVEGGDRADDPGLTSRVQAAIAAEKRLHPYAISARAERGVVRLEGEVQSEDQIEIAAELVSGVKGVQRIENRLTAPNRKTSAPEEAAQEIIDAREHNE